MTYGRLQLKMHTNSAARLCSAILIHFAWCFCVCAASATSDKQGNICCLNLVKNLPGIVFFYNTSQYGDSVGSYYSGQEGDIRPSCIVAPRDREDVSAAVRILTTASYEQEIFNQSQTHCKFAIRSGGHTPYAGSANIAGGVTIDLRGLNQIVVNDAGDATYVGPGALWGEVYDTLDPQNLTVVGGRSRYVGVGGLLTGGGISYFSPRFGFACDNVLSYEVVLADGSIVIASSTDYSDLFASLKGGSSTFGIVTRFELRTFAQGLMWGGDIMYSLTTLPQQTKAFIDFATDPNYDEHTSLIQVYVATQGRRLVINSPIYTKPEPYPQAYRRFTDIKPQVSDATRIGSHADMVADSETSQGKRNAFLTTTWRADLSFLDQHVIPAWLAFSNITANVSGLTNALLSQTLANPILTQSARHSTFARNIVPDPTAASGAPPIISMLSLTWNDAADDELMSTAAKTFIQSVESASKKYGNYIKFKYLNYADREQDVFGGYDRENVEKMKKASRKYDPQGIFQTAVPGGFKIFP
ncbi:unnamed protein product [Periconia digitata]|uniref:FAD-binding PCMH-type domain-containing protein n=1 Tax=Periconia digitata TaxID=1303443 RepID=A0A9W4XQ75_9PLEO|nr:unnamed protein product [Periconia digitata]